jgi:predicted ATPase
MNKILIQNIGSITKAELELNKVNVIMGPQSSGKSTIAKIISYCQWVEKRFVLDGAYKDDFKERFQEFHRISDEYFNSKSLIHYLSPSVSIKYKGTTHDLEIKKINNGEKFTNSKNIYIPAERNFVSVIPNLGKYKGSNDNIMNFLYDWYEVKKKYSKNNILPILNLGVSFYHIDKSDTDKIILENQKKELELTNASSGLQSVTPLLALVDYMIDSLFSEKITESVDEKNEFSNVIINHLNQLLNDDRRVEIQKQINEEKKFTLTAEETEKITILMKQRKTYHFSQFIIEEPEQNLFPKTQRDLVYYLLERLNHQTRNHRLLITTHSPYILYALNNCMMGYSVKKNMPTEEQNELKSKASWINPDFVSVWEIDESKGTVNSIKNSKTKTVDKHYFNRVMNEVMDEYYDMLNYFD